MVGLYKFIKLIILTNKRVGVFAETHQRRAWIRNSTGMGGISHYLNHSKIKAVFQPPAHTGHCRNISATHTHTDRHLISISPDIRARLRFQRHSMQWPLNEMQTHAHTYNYQIICNMWHITALITTKHHATTHTPTSKHWNCISEWFYLSEKKIVNKWLPNSVMLIESISLSSCTKRPNR